MGEINNPFGDIGTTPTLGDVNSPGALGDMSMGIINSPGTLGEINNPALGVMEGDL